MQNDWLFSFIVPVYNCEKFLSECINSILGQTYFNIEVVLVNDGSNDGSDKICCAFLEQDSRVRYLAQSNSGVSAARNAGLREAKGDFVIFVDADDIIPSNLCEKVSSKLYQWDVMILDWLSVQSSADIQEAIVNQKYEGSALQELSEVPLKEWIKKSFGMETDSLPKKINPATVWAKVYRRSFIENRELLFSTGVIVGEDMLFNLRCFAEKPRVCYYPMTAYYYRSNDVSAVNRYNPRIRKNNETFMEILCTLCQEKCPDSVEEEIQFRKLQQIVYVLSSDIFHPDNPKTSKIKKEEFLEFLENMGHQQIPFSSLKELPIKQRVALLLALSKQYEIIAMCYAIKHKIK